MTTTEAPSKALWTRANRATTAGILLLITIGAFEHLGVSTAMPKMLADLRGEALYSWPFTAFLAASVVSTVISGRVCDRVGPRPALLVGPGLFLAGLLVGGTASEMPVLLAARVLQGFGLGSEIVAIYLLVALVYPERTRPAAFGMMAAAWVVPSIVGPTAAGLITEHAGWRWVFLGLLPLALLGVLLILPAIRSLPPHEPPDAAPARRGLPWAAVAAGVGVSAVSWAAQHPSLATLWLGLGGLGLLVPALRTLLPRGTLTGRPGLPRLILARGLFAGSFFAVEAYVPLTLTAVHGYSPAAAGVPLTVGAVGWSAASWWQGRNTHIERLTLIRTGFLILSASLAAMVLIAPAWGVSWLAAPLWVAAGAGMGMSFPSLNVLMLERSPVAERGFNTSAMQVADQMFAATMIGLGGVLLTSLASAARPTPAIVVIDLAMAALALSGALLTRRGAVS